MRTSYGLDFNTFNADKLELFSGYDKCVAECHIANCGKIIVDATYGLPIDNEYDLEEIYTLLNA